MQFDQLCCSLGSQKTAPSDDPYSGLLPPGWEAALLLKEPGSNLYYIFVCLFVFVCFVVVVVLAALGLRCCVWAFSCCGEQGLLFVVVRGLLNVVDSLVAEHRL